MPVLSGALMKVIGLTGGIASGKSTVSSHLRSLGASVIDADKVAWELAEPGKAIWQAYRHRYGDEVINEDGTLNRQAVADRVFADKEELNWMNSMAHPLIKEEIGRRMSNIAQQHIPEAHVDDIVLSQRFQQLLSLHIIAANGEDNIGAAEHGDILFDGFSRGIALLKIPFIVQNVADAAGGIDAANIGA